MPGVNSIYQVTHVGYLNNQVGEIVSFWKETGFTGGGADYSEIALAFGTGSWSAAIKALMANGASYRGVIVREIDSVPKFNAVHNNADAGVGTAGANALPTQVRGLIRLNTDFSGPSGRGRKYAFFPSATDSDAAGLPSAGYQLRLATLGALLATGFTVVGAFGNTDLVPILRGKGPPLTYRNVVGFDVRGGWATQRRSGSFGRPNLQPF